MSSGLSVAYNQIHPNLNSEILKDSISQSPGILRRPGSGNHASGDE